MTWRIILHKIYREKKYRSVRFNNNANLKHTEQQCSKRSILSRTFHSLSFSFASFFLSFTFSLSDSLTVFEIFTILVLRGFHSVNTIKIRFAISR